MYYIKTYDKVAPAGVKAFNPEKYTLSDDVKNPDGILVHSTVLHDIELNPELKSIVRIGAGVNTIPVARCTEKGIVVFNCPGGNANAVKELALSALIMAMRNGFDSMEWVKSLPAEETEAGNTVEKGKSAFRGPELRGKTILVIGVGAIGSRMARICKHLDMQVFGYDPYLPDSRRNELAQYLTFVDTLEEKLPEADVVTVHCPLNEETRGSIGAKEIEQMKDGVYLLNYARGPILDEDAVCAALESGKVTAFATDFPTPKQMRMKHVVFTPHLGAGTPEADADCAIMAARQTIDYIENGNITNSVNMPNIALARSEGARVCIFHKNRIGMLGQITDKVTGMDLNIENLINKGRDEIAYTVLDFKTDVPAELEGVLTAIPDVIKVRIINK